MQDKTLGRLEENQTFVRVARELPIWQNALIGITAWFWMVSVFTDISLVIGFNSFEIYYLGGFIILLFLFALGFLMPLTFALWGVEQIYDYLKNRKPIVPFIEHVVAFLGWVISGAVLIVVPFLLFLIIDLEAISLVPFLTTVSVLLWLWIGMKMTKKQPVRKRLMVVPFMILIILSVEYVDWNSRKPFLRDLYTVKVGMTGADVKNLMGKYDKFVHDPESLTYEYLQPDFTGEETFRHTNKGYGNADLGNITFQDGRVIQVEFLHD